MSRPFPLNPSRYLSEANAAMEVYLDAMRTHWGFAPEITLKAARMVVLKARPGHGEKTSSLIVRPGGRQARNPRITARRILESIQHMHRWRSHSIGSRQHLSQASLVPWKDRLAFVEAVRREVDALVLLKPGHASVAVWAEPILLVSADFNIAGFAHDTRGFFVNLDNRDGDRKPASVAREIAAELVTHRTQCDRCGLGMPPVQLRAVGRAYGYEKGGVLDTPPDPVEEMAMPRVAAKLKKRLAAMAG